MKKIKKHTIKGWVIWAWLHSQEVAEPGIKYTKCTNTFWIGSKKKSCEYFRSLRNYKFRYHKIKKKITTSFLINPEKKEVGLPYANI